MKGGLAVAEPTYRGTLTALECLSFAEDAGFWGVLQQQRIIAPVVDFSPSLLPHL